jgi:DNA end-binding protein Ku
MPRSIWNGTIAFGAVAVPIKLYSAVQSKTVHFHEVHIKDGAPIKHRTFCSKEDVEVPRSEIVKGFEIRPGRYVVVDKDEIAAAGRRSRIIEVEHFVDAEDIDPVFYVKGYYMGARDGGEDAYRLLHDALERSGRAGIGHFTFHHREYLTAIRPYDGVLALHTMRFADELVDAGELDVPRAAREPDAREVEMARRLIESLHDDFRPETLHDEYRETVLAAIERKANGQDVRPPEEPEGDVHDDLMAALEASVDRHRGARSTKDEDKAKAKARAKAKAKARAKAKA